MIIAMGIDLIEIDRIQQAINQSPRFLMRIMTEYELKQYQQGGNRAESAAGVFAAKEAVSKVLGSGIGKISWQEIEIIKDKDGAPQVRLHGCAWELSQSRCIDQVLVSITHDKRVAMACALGQQKERKEEV